MSKQTSGASITIGNRRVGPGHPCFVLAEIGINHNGDLETAKRLIDAAALAGCDAVKFQKRTPDVCVPEDQKGIERDTPWGRMTYLEYRKRVEFGEAEYKEIDRYCRERKILWTCSCWDVPALDFTLGMKVSFLKIPSAVLTDEALLNRHIDSGLPLVVSTGMSSWEEIERAAALLKRSSQWMLLHCTSTYPSSAPEINLRVMETLREAFHCPVGYSGHEVGLQISLAAVALGACMIERHITLDRTMWGTDQAASVEPQGFHRLVRDIRVIEQAMGDGIKRVYDSEKPIRAKLRRHV
jgi:N-acetylneuraminate synthase